MFFGYIISAKWINVGIQVEESEGLAEFESGVPVDYSFSNFSFKVLSHDLPVYRSNVVWVYNWLLDIPCFILSLSSMYRFVPTD